MVPFEHVLWTVEEVANYFQISPKNIAQRLTSQPSFPRPLVIPRADGGNLHPRWRAKDVVSWAEAFGQ